MSRISAVVVALSFTAAVVISAEAAQRAFVSSSGDDANTASGCGLAAPCRSFASAQTVVSDGGEIVALDAAGYGPITITKSVTITANPGFYAGIAVASGDAVTINTPSINVTLRGLNINGIGGYNGVVVGYFGGGRLSIENCIISNFANDGVQVAGGGVVRIVDSLIRDNVNNGVLLAGGGNVSISGSKILGNGQVGVYLFGSYSGSTTTAAIGDSVISGNVIGVGAYTVVISVIVRASITRSEITNGTYGVVSDHGVGTQIITISSSLVTGNSTAGLYQNPGTGTTILESLGDNTVRQNGSDTTGTITLVSGT
jgi:Right handed beta helix region